MSDLTGDPTGESRPLPTEWQSALLDAFPDAVVDTIFLGDSAGGHRALIPGTRIVIRLKPFLWDGLQSVARALLALQSLHNDPDKSAIQAFVALDTIRKLPSAFVKLSPEDAECCTYAALCASGTSIERSFDVYPRFSELWESHQGLRKNCQISRCPHFQNGCCATEPQIQAAVDRLVTKKVVEKHGEGLWVTL